MPVGKSRAARGELLAALAVVAFGGMIAWIGSGYHMGTPSRMGPGYFPVMLGGGLILVGLGLVIETWRSTPDPQIFPWRAVCALIAGVVAFALLVRSAGLVPAIFALVLIATLGESPWKPVGALVIAAAMSVIAVALFLYGLRVPLRPFWW